VDRLTFRRGLPWAAALLLVVVVAVLVQRDDTGAARAAGSATAPAPAPAPAPASDSARSGFPTSAVAVGAAAKKLVGFWANGSWCWFQDPRAVRVVGQYDQTFVGWIGWDGAVTVGAFDPEFGVRTSTVIGHLFHDDHGSPAIFVEPDNRLTVFFSAHNGHTMYYRTTLRPEDITTWGPLQRVPARLGGDLGFTYPNPVSLSAENHRLYLFWRGATWSSDYATRAPDGSWTQAHPLISNPPQRPYVKVAGNGIDRIALAYTNGHPRNLTTSIYYAGYRGGWLRHADGRKIARMGSGPIAPQQGDLIYDGPSHHASGWVWDVALSPSGGPVVVYATFGSLVNHKYWYATWTGQRWVSHFMTYGGPSISPRTIEKEYSGGIQLDHQNPSIVYLSRKVNGLYQIERWVTGDGGASWSHSTVVRTPGQNAMRPILTRGSNGGPMTLLWLEGNYGSYSNYRTRIAYLK
jgi:hypothetical protein